MYPVYTGQDIRRAEKPLLDAGHGARLMSLAAWGLATETAKLLRNTHGISGSRVTGLIGKGNNGADALWAMSFLASRGVSVTAVIIIGTTEELHPQARAAFLAAGGKFVSRIHPDTAIVIDAVLGTGFNGTFNLPALLREKQLAVPPTALVVACDIPSGVLADTGDIPAQALKADLTVTFGGAKLGLLAGAGGQHSCKVVVIDIGITQQLEQVAQKIVVPEPNDIAQVFSPPTWNAHKYSRGVLAVAAGSTQYPGAGLLVVAAAQACGIGMVQYVLPRPADGTERQHTSPLGNLVIQHSPSAVLTGPEDTTKATAFVVGPGLGTTTEAQNRLAQISSSVDSVQTASIPVVVDASALEMISAEQLSQRSCLVLTPHAGELTRLIQRLAPELAHKPAVEQALGFATKYRVYVVFKGPTTYVCTPEGSLGVHPQQSSDLATAGTGDTLAGILGACLATTSDYPVTDVLQRLLAGVKLHAQAAVAAAQHGPVSAELLAPAIRSVLAQVRTVASASTQ